MMKSVKWPISRKKVLQNLLLVGISLLIGIVLSECLLRVVYGRDYLAIEPVLKSGRLLYEPNQVAEFRMFGEINTTITINSDGFRDTEFSPSSTDATMLALGDSFTEGYGVDLEESYVKVLQDKLVEPPFNIKHVYNAGHNGTNPKNYATVYRDYFKSNASVSIVTLGFFLGNDIIEESTPEYLQNNSGLPGRSLKLLLSQNSSLYNFLRRQVRYSRNLEQFFSLFGLTSPPAFPGDSYASQDKSRWPYTAKYIHELFQRISNDKRRFLLVLIPTKEMIDETAYIETLAASEMPVEDIELYGFRDFVLSYCIVNHIPVIDLTPEFQEYFRRTQRDLYFRTDDHWNASGHEFAAESLFGYFKSNFAPPN